MSRPGRTGTQAGSQQPPRWLPPTPVGRLAEGLQASDTWDRRPLRVVLTQGRDAGVLAAEGRADATSTAPAGSDEPVPVITSDSVGWGAILSAMVSMLAPASIAMTTASTMSVTLG